MVTNTPTTDGGRRHGSGGSKIDLSQTVESAAVEGRSGASSASTVDRDG